MTKKKYAPVSGCPVCKGEPLHPDKMYYFSLCKEHRPNPSHIPAPSDSEVEAAARALCSADGDDPDLSAYQASYGRIVANWEHFAFMAKAALTAFVKQRNGEK